MSSLVEWFDNIIEFIEKNRSDHRPAEEHQGIPLGAGQADKRRTRTPAANNKTNAKNQTANDLRRPECVESIYIFRYNPSRLPGSVTI